MEETRLAECTVTVDHILHNKDTTRVKEENHGSREERLMKSEKVEK